MATRTPKPTLMLMLPIVAVMSAAAVGALAEEPTRVVVLAEPSAGPTMIQLVEELSALGFAVVTAKASGDGKDEIVAASRTHQAPGVVRLVPPDGAIQVWIVAADGQPVLAEVVRPESERVEDRRTAVLRAIERLRASSWKAGQRSPEPAPSSDSAARALQSSRAAGADASSGDRLTPSIGAGVINSRGGVGTTGHAVMSLAWNAGHRLSVRGFGMLPVIHGTVEGPEGKASFSPTLLGAGAGYSFGSARGLKPSLEGGAAAVFVDTQGTGAEGYQGKHDSTLIALPYVGFGITAPVTGIWRLRADLLLGTSLPRVTVLYAGRETSEWGSLVVAGSVSVGLALF